MTVPTIALSAAEASLHKNAFRSLVFSSPLFRDVDEATKLELVESASLIRVAAGTALMKQGDVGDGLFLIVNGNVRVETNAGPNTVPLAELGAGACIGEVALVSAKERTATVTALTQVDCGKLDADAVRNAAEKFPALKARLQQLIQARAEDAVSKILG